MERSLQDEVKDLESQLEILSLNKFNSASDKDKREEFIAQYKKALNIILEYSSSDTFAGTALNKRQLPRLIIFITAHCGKHPWTSSQTRNIAKNVLDSVIVKCGCSSMAELLVGEIESCIKQSPYLPLTDDADVNFITDDPLLDKNFNECHSKKEVKDDTGDLVVDKEQESGTTLSGTQMEGKELMFQLGILKYMFSIFKTRLTKDKWIEYPTERHALVWCLRSLKHPHLSSWIESFLPPLLMFTDHHEVGNHMLHHKLLGLSCMAHLIRNVNAAEMRWYNRVMVVYEAIHRFLYFNDVEVIISVHRCMLLLLPIVDGPSPLKVDAPSKPSKTDEVFGILLNSMDFESKLPQKRAYSASVVGYIELLGIHCARHLKRLLSIICQYLQFPDAGEEECRLNCLRALLVLMRNVWPRIPYHQNDIIKSLVRLMSDCCQQDGTLPKLKSSESRVINGIIKCLIMLQRCCPSLKLQELFEGCEHEGLKHCIQQSTMVT